MPLGLCLVEPGIGPFFTGRIRLGLALLCLAHEHDFLRERRGAARFSQCSA